MSNLCCMIIDSMKVLLLVFTRGDSIESCTHKVGGHLYTYLSFTPINFMKVHHFIIIIIIMIYVVAHGYMIYVVTHGV